MAVTRQVQENVDQYSDKDLVAETEATAMMLEGFIDGLQRRKGRDGWQVYPYALSDEKATMRINLEMLKKRLDEYLSK